MEDVVIVSGARTPIGRFQGAYSNLSASDLAAIVIKAAVERAGIKPADVDTWCWAASARSPGTATSRVAPWLGIPIETPAVTVSGICGSGLRTINTGARDLQTGDARVVVAGGAENMTMMPYYLRQARAGYRMGNGTMEDGILHLLGDPFSKVHMGITAENLAEKYEVSREAQDEVAVRSQERAKSFAVTGSPLLQRAFSRM
jgi:acetyl-CoA C-acetyltransferase